MSRENIKRMAREQEQKIKNDKIATEKAIKDAAKIELLNLIKTDEGRAKLIEDIKQGVASGQIESWENAVDELSLFASKALLFVGNPSKGSLKSISENSKNLSKETIEIMKSFTEMAEKFLETNDSEVRKQLSKLASGVKSLETSLRTETATLKDDVSDLLSKHNPTIYFDDFNKILAKTKIMDPGESRNLLNEFCNLGDHCSGDEYQVIFEGFTGCCAKDQFLGDEAP